MSRHSGSYVPQAGTWPPKPGSFRSIPKNEITPPPIVIPQYGRQDKRPPPSMVSRQGTKRRGIDPQPDPIRGGSPTSLSSGDVTIKSGRSNVPQPQVLPKFSPQAPLPDLPSNVLPDWRHSPHQPVQPGGGYQVFLDHTLRMSQCVQGCNRYLLRKLLPSPLSGSQTPL